MPRSASVPERFIYEERFWARDTLGSSNDQYRELNYANFFFFFLVVKDFFRLHFR